MGQYSMNAYDADIYIRQFKGLISNGNDPDGNLEYAVEAENVDTTDGFLQPAADPTITYAKDHPYYQKTPDELFLGNYESGYWTDQYYNGQRGKFWKDNPDPETSQRIPNIPMTEEEIAEAKEKLLLYYTGDTKAITDEEYKSKFRLVAKMHEEVPRNSTGTVMDSIDVYVFTSGNGFFVMTTTDVDPTTPDYQTNPMYINQCRPLDVTAKINQDGTVDDTYYEGWDMENPPAYEDLTWSVVTFQSTPSREDNVHPSGSPGQAVHGNMMVGSSYYFADNALYLSNEEKGLYCIQVFHQDQTPSVGLNRHYLHVEAYKIYTPVNFGHIEAFGERLWGCSIKADMESLYYSTPYNPFDWQQNADNPADGAGQIVEPNWDGDRFTGLRSFGNNLIAFKTHRAWKVAGVDLATMVITEQYGFGTEFVDTVISSGERLYMATRNGLAVYDGSNIRPLMQDNLRNLWSRIRQSAMDKMRAFLYENRKYCLAVPVDSDENNTLIVYDTIDGTVFFYEDMNIVCFRHPTKAQEPIVLWRDGTRSNMKQFDFNAWEKDLSGTRATRWMTPWIELGRKDIQKGGHDFYFTPEVNGENAVTFTISFQTEKKTKTKQYTVQPMTAAEIAAGKQGKTKRLHFGGTGRRFRIIIETPSGVDAGKAYKWRLYGGIHLITEIDKD